jgi:hypothetical protein
MVLALVVVAPPARAASEQDTTTSQYREKVKLAGAAWITETETITSDLTIRVFYLSTFSTADGKIRYTDPQVTLFYTHVELDSATNLSTRTEYEGFLATEGSTFAFSDSLDLASASLTVPLYGYQCINEGGPVGIAPEPECYEIEPITVGVDVDWTGIGEIQHDSYGDSVLDIPGFRFRSMTVSDTRGAGVEGLVAGDGVELASGTATVGVLIKGDYRETTVTR